MGAFREEIKKECERLEAEKEEWRKAHSEGKEQDDWGFEESVLEGAMDLDGVQKKLKVGVGSPEIITEVEQLIRFYKEKYYG